MVRVLPDGYYQRATSFSEPVMIAHAVTLEVELQKGDQAVRMATTTQADAIPSRPRRARHHQDGPLRHEPGDRLGLA